MITTGLVFFGLILFAWYVMLVKRDRVKKELSGRVVLITGGGSGIGRSMAKHFARQGCTIVLWDLRKELLDKTVVEIRGIQRAHQGQSKSIVLSYVCDVSVRSMVYEVASTTKGDLVAHGHKGIDILVNNAGIVGGHLFLDTPDDILERTMNVNMLAHFWTTRAFLPDMVARNDGHIVSISSVMSLCHAARLADYCASKSAATAFHESLRLELHMMGKFGVKTTLVCPYAINTGMFAGASALLPMLKEDDVASAVVDAVIRERKVLVIPSWFNVTVILGRILPTEWRDFLIGHCGGYRGMDKFEGRGDEWVQKKIE